MAVRKLTPEALQKAAKMRDQNATLAEIAQALQRDLGISVTESSLSRKLRKVEGMPCSNVGRPRKDPDLGEPTRPRVVPRPAVTPEMAKMRGAAKEHAERKRTDISPVGPELPPEGCSLEELRDYEAARIYWELERANIMDAEAFAVGDQQRMLAVQKLRAALRAELRALIPPKPPDPALDPANTTARDIVIAWIEDMVPRDVSA